MKKRIVTVIAVIVYLGLLITTWKTDWFITEVANNLETSVTLTFTLFIYGYNNWNWLFLLVRRFLMWCSGDTVAWKGSYKFFLEKGEFSKTNEEFYQELKKDIKKINKNNDTLDIEFDGDAGEQTIRVIKTEFSEYDQIYFEYKVSKAYKDSRREIDYFKSYLDCYKECAARRKPVDGIQGSEGKKAIYCVEVKMQKNNPFYGLMVKRLNQKEQKTFNLTFSNNKGLDVEIKPKVIILRSKKSEIIESALSEYIALGSII